MEGRGHRRHPDGDRVAGRGPPGGPTASRASGQLRPGPGHASGFRRHSGSTQRSLYVGATRDTDASYFKLFGFAGQEQSQLAFLAADEDTLDQVLRANPMSPDERDQFGQRFVTAQYHRALGADTELSVQGYYNGAGGWYRIANASGGLYQYGLDWSSVGATASYRAVRGALDLTWGGHVNDFESRHEREIVGGPFEYANRGYKNEANSFVKLGYAAGRWRHYGDVQVRWARFRFDGCDETESPNLMRVFPPSKLDLGSSILHS